MSFDLSVIEGNPIPEKNVKIQPDSKPYHIEFTNEPCHVTTNNIANSDHSSHFYRDR